MGDVALGAILAMSRAIRAYRKRKRRTLEINKYAAERWGSLQSSYKALHAHAHHGALSSLTRRAACMHVLTTAPSRH